MSERIRKARWVILAVWITVTLLGGVIGSQVFDRFSTETISSDHESIQAQEELAENTSYGPSIDVIVTQLDLTQPDALKKIAKAFAALDTHSDISAISPPQAAQHSDTAARLRIILHPRDTASDLNTARESVTSAIEDIEPTLDTAFPEKSPKLTLGGALIVQRDTDNQTTHDTKKGEMIALPVTLLVMVLLFGGFLLASLPIIAAVTSIATTLLALYGLSFLLPLNSVALSAATVLGLGLSIDYSLLIVNRYREEIALHPPHVAFHRTLSTAGRTVLFSAFTVSVSLSGLFVFPSPLLTSLGAAGCTVVVFASAAALTLTPALIVLFQRRIRARPRASTTTHMFSSMARWSQRWRIPVTIGVTAALLLSAAPFLGVKFFDGGAQVLPHSAESRQFLELSAKHFTGTHTPPVVCLIKATPEEAEAWVEQTTRDFTLTKVSDATPLDEYSTVSLYAENNTDAKRLVRYLRDHRPDAPLWVSGEAAVSVDLDAEIRTYTPRALIIVALAISVLLFLLTGSLLVPVKAMVMNTLSLGASFGLLVWIFQKGYLSGLLGFTPMGSVETYIPVIVFAFAFGLSMDYEVFLLARIKELYDRGYSNAAAVEVGVQRTGGIITAAAALMLIVFAGFAAGEMISVKQLGIALAVAVAVDATIVRCLLLPATMALLGSANWWAPRPLARLYERWGISENDLDDSTAPIVGVAYVQRAVETARGTTQGTATVRGTARARGTVQGTATVRGTAQTRRTTQGTARVTTNRFVGASSVPRAARQRKSAS